MHFEDELLDGGLAELAQDLAVRDSLSHRPILRAYCSIVKGSRGVYVFVVRRATRKHPNMARTMRTTGADK
jgi:hypothetical protein